MNLLPIFVPFIIFQVFFILCFFTKRISFVDTAWGLGFVLLDQVLRLKIGYSHFAQPAVSFLIAIWGLRLGVYLFTRSLIEEHEDFRYAELMNEWSPSPWSHAFAKIFVLQPFLMILVAMPIILPYYFPRPLLSYDQSKFWIPNVLYFTAVFGFLLEAVADTHLFIFKRNPENKGKKLKSGVWVLNYPNYLGEIIFWWSIGIIGTIISGPICLVGPIVITFFLIKVTGVKYLKRRLANYK